VELNSARRIAIIAPNLTSGQVFVRPALDATSAAAVRAFNPRDGSAFTWACGSAGGYLEVSDLVVYAASHVRLECGVAQTAPRSFAVITAR
jgi:hypothetical protein